MLNQIDYIIMKKIILVLFMMSFAMQGVAYDFKVDGIYYEIIDESKQIVAVTYKDCYRGIHGSDSYEPNRKHYKGHIEIPKTVTRKEKAYIVEAIGDNAFSGCYDMISVTIPNSVTKIGNHAFNNCAGLTSITIPNSIVFIGSQPFSGCDKLELVNFNADNFTHYSNIFGVNAFGENKNKSLKTIHFGEGVKSIPEGILSQCKELTSVTIPNTVTSIGDYAFSGCSKLASISFPDSLKSIGNYAFCDCVGLTALNIPNSVISIGRFTFKDCVNLKEVTIGEAVKEIDSDAFSGCTGVETLNYNAIDAKVANIVGVYGYVYQAFGDMSRSIKTLQIGNKVKKIPDYAVVGFNRLTHVQLPNSVKEIGAGAFVNCNLNTLIIGAEVTKIGVNRDVTYLHDRRDWFRLNDHRDAYISIKTIWLTNTPPEGYENAEGAINYVANDLYTGLKTVWKYPYLSSMFVVDGVRYVPSNPSERICDAIDCTYDPQCVFLRLPKIVSYKGVDMSLNLIGHYAFHGNSYINKCTIFSDYRGPIGYGTFKGCVNLEEIAIPEAMEYSFYDYAFCDCKSLKNILIPKGVPAIGNYAFGGCVSLSNVVIADRDKPLKLYSNQEKGLFNDCPLDSVYIGGDISYYEDKEHGYSPFFRNQTLRAVKIAERETTISNNEFYGCSNLKSVIVGGGVTYIGNNAFSGCLSLERFEFGKSLKFIGAEAFSDCTSLISIYSKSNTPPICEQQALDDLNKWNCKLYVPTKALNKYKVAEQWKEFFYIDIWE